MADKYNFHFQGLYFVLTLSFCVFHKQGGDGAPKEEVNTLHIVSHSKHQTFCIITFFFHSEHNVPCAIRLWSIRMAI